MNNSDPKQKRYPSPPPAERKQPLPWEQPKSETEDEAAHERIRQITTDISYQVADQDVGFLHTTAERGVRLQIDYQKAENILNRHGIEKTIVVFGSTRLRETETARRELESARRDAADHPGDPRRQKALRLAERRLDLSRYYEIGREFGRLVSQAGHGPKDSRVVIATGGGPGAMESANRGAFDVEAKTVGFNIKLPREQYPNPYITPGLCMQFHYFAMRKLHFMQRAAAIVALPGGFGTLDELFGAITLIQTRKSPPIPVVLIGESYWRGVFDAQLLAEAGSIDEEDMELFWFVETAQEAWDSICQWHEHNGTPLYPD